MIKDQIKYHNFEKKSESHATINDPNIVRKVSSIAFPFNSSQYKRWMGHGEQQGGYAEVTVSIRIAVPDVIFSLKYIRKYPGTWHASIGLENAIFLNLDK